MLLSLINRTIIMQIHHAIMQFCFITNCWLFNCCPIQRKLLFILNKLKSRFDRNNSNHLLKFCDASYRAFSRWIFLWDTVEYLEIISSWGEKPTSLEIVGSSRSSSSSSSPRRSYQISSVWSSLTVRRLCSTTQWNVNASETCH